MSLMGHAAGRTHASDIPLLTRRIREQAQALGFFNAGFAPAGPLPWAEHYRSWLQAGFHGAMGYMERQAPRREHPDRILANVQSLVLVGLPYYHPRVRATDTLVGRISRYAWGGDYHQLIGERLSRLLAFVRSQVPMVQGAGYVDTGPVMEKVWAAHTALGWMGKHTSVIARNYGSWFFIGALLLDIPLEYDVPVKNSCGTCSRCLQACPTGALVAPYILDARRCISYLTVEFRGIMPRELRPLIGNRIYGCDTCQDACPWNRKVASSGIKGLEPKDEMVAPHLFPLAHLSREAFDRCFERSPIRRITRDGWVRNVMIALGNSSDSACIPVVRKALDDASALVRIHAAWALSRLSCPDLRPILEAVRVKEHDPAVLAEIASILE